METTTIAYKKCKCPVKLEVWTLLRKQALDIVERESFLGEFINQSILSHDDFGSALSARLARKLAGKVIEEKNLYDLFLETIMISRGGNLDEDVERLAMMDMVAVEQRDPACRSVATVFLYFKGFLSIQCHRMAHILWMRGRLDVAMYLQSKSAEILGVDIHPGAKIGCGLMIDHGTGVVIGETSVIGSNCTFLHGVTLGGTGKNSNFDRHPKLGDNVFLGCGVSILGNIQIGNNVIVGAGSLVLKPLPEGATAVGSPAVIKYIDPKFIEPVSENKTEIEPKINLSEKVKVKESPEKDDESITLQLWSSKWIPKSWSIEIDGWIGEWKNNSNTTFIAWEDRTQSYDI